MGELIDLLIAGQGFELLEKLNELFDRCLLLSQSNLGISETRRIVPSLAEEILGAIMGQSVTSKEHGKAPEAQEDGSCHEGLVRLMEAIGLAPHG